MTNVARMLLSSMPTFTRKWPIISTRLMRMSENAAVSVHNQERPSVAAFSDILISLVEIMGHFLVNVGIDESSIRATLVIQLTAYLCRKQQRDGAQVVSRIVAEDDLLADGHDHVFRQDEVDCRV